MDDIVWFSEVGKEDTALVGGKGANLGELYKLKVPIPNGFIVTSQAYFNNLKASGADQRIRGLLYGLDVNNPVALQQKALACQAEIQKIELDSNLQKTIEKYYQKLSAGKSALVAVRSSATAEDLPGASFAGQQKTFLNVRGKESLKKAILDGWASLFEARAIFYRVQKKFDHFKVGIAIPVQKMVESQTSGIMFTVDPVTNSRDITVIEAVFGLGEYIVGGVVTPDHYEVNKKTYEITAKKIATQTKMLVYARDNQNKEVTVAKLYRRSQKLPDQKIVELAKIGARVEKHYFFPQDMEWAYEDNNLYIVQTRPVTTLKGKTAESLTKSSQKEPTEGVILIGSPASPGVATGPVVIIKSPQEIGKVKKGDVLVTDMTNPDYVPAMKKAAAIVTNKGGRTSHAAIVSREMGIPAVVGTEHATSRLRNGQIVTVDGAKGLIFKAQTRGVNKNLKDKRKIAKTRIVKTATKLYVNLAEPELAHEVAVKDVDGVGLLRAEFILAQIGTHPKTFLAEKRGSAFTEKLSSKLEIFARSFSRRPVIYRATDLKSNEYRNLKGGEKYEPREPNPMLGYRGAFRYIKDPDVFKLELAAIVNVRKKHPNLHLMIPFVRTVDELKAVKEIVGASGLFNDADFKFWMMAEIPANAILLEDFIKVGIDGVSIGSNDLTMLVLGTDRDNDEVATEFNELNPSVLWFLERIVSLCVKNNVTCSICGQAPSIYPELTEKLVSWGITSISVNPDALDATRQLIYEAEHKLISKIKSKK